jgi:DNA invertase Pin-like site-specific DNA recombinase
MAVYGYIRSGTRNDDEDLQRRRIEWYAAGKCGLELDQIFVDRDVSGTLPLGKRPEGRRLLNAATAGDVVITLSLFHSARNVLDVYRQLARRGIALHIIEIEEEMRGSVPPAPLSLCDHIGSEAAANFVFALLSARASAERAAAKAERAAIAARNGSATDAERDRIREEISFAAALIENSFRCERIEDDGEPDPDPRPRLRVINGGVPIRGSAFGDKPPAA